ncbi:conserved hypothetical protein [Altererythrobacter sp. B11]|uniref:SMP-30/gluconolactonase/LRE family protein n=1 Tax=Altererythrobacter sp. B11 TaxID=2060312 RepID=UPI000DC715B9|nr:SMP-30/gluconolactonase/LRE family protein [Altererythrobacter sp. B11]BBC73805.1 conserved hypothetical protein [Altererythrobacter sp. B11]
MSVIRVAAGTGAALLLCAALAACSANTPGRAAPAPAVPQDIVIAGENVFPESITSDAAGNIYVGSGHGTIYRAAPGADTAQPWIRASAANTLNSLFGVLADDAGGRLWTCSNPDMFAGEKGASHLVAFELHSGEFIESLAFPEGRPTACNDIAVAANGTVYATDTASGRIFRRAPGGELELFADGQDLIGVDGIAFADDGTMYINNVRQNLVQRVELDSRGAYGGLTTLHLSQAVGGPDGLRPLGGHRFLQAEGTAGRVALVEVDGDRAQVTTLRDGLDSSAAVTRVGDVAYATEGKIRYRIDPALRGKDPGTFTIRAFALPEDL